METSPSSDECSQAYDELGVSLADRAAIEDFLEPLKQKDNKTYEHCIRVGLLARKIGGFLKENEKALLFAGLLHDLGKLNIPGEILNKTGKWNDEDFRVVEQHVIRGYEAIKGRFDFTAEIILLHHRFQEKRYPEVLPPSPQNFSEETMSLVEKYARILAMADVFDALHREDNKFGKKRKLNGVEIKEKMLELNRDGKELVNDLYEAKVFSEDESERSL